LSTYDQIILEGWLEGWIESKIEGHMGGEMRQIIALINKLFLKLPYLSDEEIADLTDLPLKLIQALRLKVPANQTLKK
jgi:hypothetical protein